MPMWLQIIIVASTFAGLLFAGVGVWYGLREKQTQIGASMTELRDTVAEQQKALEAAERRFRNLEAIVTSQMWDAVNDESSTATDEQRAISRAGAGLGIPEAKSSDAEHVARIARRLKG